MSGHHISPVKLAAVFLLLCMSLPEATLAQQYSTGLLSNRLLGSQVLDVVVPLDANIGSSHAVASAYLNFIDTRDYTPDFVAAWSHGYTPFIKAFVWAPLPDCPSPYGTVSAANVARGFFDSPIITFANRLRTALQANAQRRIFISLFQEANGDWTCWRLDPAGHKQSWWRIKQLFAEAGVPAGQVIWVFDPNGWTPPNQPAWESYYPGHSIVDAVAYVWYNLRCTDVTGAQWLWPNVQVDPPQSYVARAMAMAPGKAVIMSAGASSSYPLDTQSPYCEATGTCTNKNAWINQEYSLLPQRGVKLIVWDNEVPVNPYPKCDFPIYFPSHPAQFRVNPAYKNAVISGVPLPPAALNPTRGVFEDVWPAQPWSGQPDRSDRVSIEALFAAGYTAGCSNQFQPIGWGDRSQLFRYYCPDAVTDRAQASVIVLKAKYTPAYVPPPATGLFADVPTNVWYAPWVEQMYRDGITSGCGTNPLRFCPTNPVTRAQLAVFLVRAEGWSLVTPTGARFSDVPTSHWAAAYIETLDAHNAATRCNGNNFCPDIGATRGQMAIFTAKAEGLVP